MVAFHEQDSNKRVLSSMSEVGTFVPLSYYSIWDLLFTYLELHIFTSAEAEYETL